jgi:hypothetical protein
MKTLDTKKPTRVHTCQSKKIKNNLKSRNLTLFFYLLLLFPFSFILFFEYIHNVNLKITETIFSRHPR